MCCELWPRYLVLFVLNFYLFSLPLSTYSTISLCFSFHIKFYDMKHKIKKKEQKNRKSRELHSVDGSLENCKNFLDEQNVDSDAFKYQTTFSTLRPFMGRKIKTILWTLRSNIKLLHSHLLSEGRKKFGGWRRKCEIWQDIELWTNFPQHTKSPRFWYENDWKKLKSLLRLVCLLKLRIENCLAFRIETRNNKFGRHYGRLTASPEPTTKVVEWGWVWCCTQ